MTQRKTVVTNFIWRLAERSGAQGITFIVSIILARLLDPKVYGLVALVTVFTHILQVFVDSGMGNALIQKKDADELDYSSVFYFNLAVCIILYLLMFFAAPLIANFYKKPELISIVRVISLTLVISGVKNIQQAYVSKNLLFRRFFYSTLGGTIGSAVAGITMAYMGFGVWALVVQQLFNLFVDTCILWITVPWRPKKMFSFSRLKGLFTFGWKLLVSGLLDTVYNNIRSLLIGKLYTSEDLAYYNKGNQWPYLIITNVNTSISSVIFPVMSATQEDNEKIKKMTRRVIRVSSYVIWPLMVGLAVCAKTLVKVLLTEKWLPCVPFLQTFCIAYAFWPIHTANLNAIKALGRSDIFMKLEIIKKGLGLFFLVVSLPFGAFAIALVNAISSPVDAVINSLPNKKLLKYPIREQIWDILPTIILSFIMGAIVYSISFISIFNDICLLLVQVLTGVICYILLSICFRMDSFYYIKDMLTKGIIQMKGRKKK